MENNKGLAIGLVIAIAVVLGVVGFMAFSDDSDDSSNTNETQTSQSEEATEPAQANIVELAQQTDALSTLVQAVVAADLVETLSDPNAEYTVFAPTNEAFAALPDGTLESLLEPENINQLTDILTYHVVVGEAFSTDLSDGMMIETVQGQDLEVRITNGVVTVGGATVVQADVEASNGVVHVIDQVLLPQ